MRQTDGSQTSPPRSSDGSVDVDNAATASGRARKHSFDTSTIPLESEFWPSTAFASSFTLDLYLQFPPEMKAEGSQSSRNMTSAATTGRATLHLAALHGNVSMAELLIQQRADIGSRDGVGCTACILQLRLGTMQLSGSFSASRLIARLHGRLDPVLNPSAVPLRNSLSQLITTKALLNAPNILPSTSQNAFQHHSCPGPQRHRRRGSI